ncbi:MAG: thymidine phosphorylase [Ignavibacteriae bacterium]|nr:thymidine phosphorylase [Ignavibacteriota bacterium]
MNPVELIRKKRNGSSLTKKELEPFITAHVKDELPDYQMSAFLMAVYFKGMTPEETSTFTEVMLHSGEVVDLSAIPGRKVDKHSTGGVGDKVSLILAPTVAACGVPVPMISGRGLGHTGGTLDKLESIPGFRTDLSIEEYKKVIAELGIVLIGQTKEIAPADKRMYALRDVTATVESIPLIAGSIMSKKLAEGIDALVLDVKTGNGAFMQKYEDSVALAQALVSIGNSVGKETIGFITDMSQPLGMMIGNWWEVVESVECLRGKNVPDLMEVTLVLGGAMVYLGGNASSIEEGMKLCSSAIWSGKAYGKFVEIVERQGGDTTFVEHPERYPASEHTVEVKSLHSGYVSSFETMRIGLLAVELGAGRQKVDDVIDPKAGIVLTKKLGDTIQKNETLALIHTDRSEVIDKAERELVACIGIGDTIVPRGSCTHAYVDRDGVKPWTRPEIY